jgi:predicted RecA/RadA family phage recombinase
MKPIIPIMCAAVIILWAGGAAEAKSPARTVTGEVVAVNLTDSPQVIVVSTKVGKKQEEMIVGAAVESGAQITRGKDRVALSDIKVGQKVELTYVKSDKGLTAQSIRLK